MPRTQPPTQTITGFQSTQSILGAGVLDAKGESDQVALIKAVSRARLGVLNEFGALRQAWEGVTVSPGLTPEAQTYLNSAILESHAIPDTFGLLSKTLVRDEQSLAHEIKGIREQWPTGLSVSSLIGVTGTPVDDSILTYDTTTSKWGVFSGVLINESEGITNVSALSFFDTSTITSSSFTPLSSFALNAMTDLTLGTISGNLTLSPASSLILPAFSNGLLQVNSSSIVNRVQGTTANSLLAWNSSSSQWEEVPAVTASGVSLGATILNLGTTVFGSDAISPATNVNFFINTSGTGDITLTAAGNLKFAGLVNGFLKADGSSVISATGLATTDIPATTRQFDRLIYIESPTATDDFPVCKVPQACTVKRVVGVTDVGTVDFNIEKRNKLTPDIAGTNIFTVDKQATTAGLDQTVIDSDAVTADQWLTYTASAIASAPTKLWVGITLEKD